MQSKNFIHIRVDPWHIDQSAYVGSPAGKGITNMRSKETPSIPLRSGLLFAVT